MPQNSFFSSTEKGSNQFEYKCKSANDIYNQHQKSLEMPKYTIEVSFLHY